MRRLIKWGIILGILGLIGWSIAIPGMAYMKERRKVTYREAEVTHGQIVSVVNSTGTVKPVQSVAVGSFVSGPIDEIFVDFNDEVKKGQIMARIDPRIYKANVARDDAILATRNAEVERVNAELQQAKNDEARAYALQAENKAFISAAEIDQFKFKRQSLEAQLLVAEANVRQAQANLDQSKANLEYTRITAPTDGVVIDRKVDPGQTVAASYQTPELFVVAPDMRKEMRVFASVDEADIGLIREAQRTGLPVRFTVDAYPGDLFSGTIFQIRRNSTTTQNVVTYPVVVSAPNPDLKLLPGMTASISFQVGERADVLRIPNAALRFYPQREQVRPEDRPVLEGAAAAAGKSDDEDERERLEASKSADEKAELRRQRNRRHVWLLEGELLRAVEVVTGLADGNNTELVSGDLKVGQKLVTGIQPRQ
ncbi:MAG TPA: efflux RND transporter periplasmic adaptor subunit [Gemmataceae bacterium]|nr:efflux RND transporter periplasmic adaptor subunit [Gemmataceae bacterium]